MTVKPSRRQLGAGLCLLPLVATPALANMPRDRRGPLFSPLAGRRIWLGPDLWANRLQDWRSENGLAICQPMSGKRALSTACLLTLDWNPKGSLATMAVPLKLEGTDGSVFAGLLIGAGAGKLDYRAAALVQGCSGEGGGILAAISPAGTLGFFDHTDEAAGEKLAPLSTYAPPPSPQGLDGILRLSVQSTGNISRLTLEWIEKSGSIAAKTNLELPTQQLVGSVHLAVAAATPQTQIAFGIPQVTGDRFRRAPERTLGPIVSSLYSLSKGTLKLTAQLMPVGAEDARTARLEIRPDSSGTWKEIARGSIEDGYTVQFRATNWKASADVPYRVVYPIGGKDTYHNGLIREEPADRPLNLGLFSCVAATFRQLDGPPEGQELPQAKRIGRFAPESFVFPHRELIASTAAQDPDLLVFCGDQFYEQYPTKAMNESHPEGSADELKLDGLYKWLLWCWAFRDLVKDRPSIVMMDDHDYFQPNYWGNGGRAAPERDHNRGGYTRPVDYVRMMERCETSHNPDAYDPSPVDQGIGVYYGAFVYGGVSFAILEDRKFKTAILQGPDMDVYNGQLLGERQEAFLEKWQGMDAGLPKIVLTQTVWSCPQTTPEGEPLIDFDSNGFPPLGRRRALELVKSAKAVILSGDQHMASLVRQGLDDFIDGPLQFTGPAGGCGWQRWFEPALPLANPRPGTRNSGDFIDGFGNKQRVLAVATPRLSFAEYRRHKQGRTQRIMDRTLKREGFGMVRIDPKASQVTFECWPWNAATLANAEQYAGWPYVLDLKEA